jgi:predicted AAA+ superfamily ATPase
VPWEDLRAYVQLYLQEEIIAEAIVRKIDHYAQFVDMIGRCFGEELNYQNIANDSDVQPRTVANFVEILKDTLVAFELEPYGKTKKRKAVTKSNIFMFDVGVANYLSCRKESLIGSEAFGKSFEHFIIQEVRAYVGYSQLDLPLCYWRTTVGQYEVDCILMKHHVLVCRDPISRKVADIDVMP